MKTRNSVLLFCVSLLLIGVANTAVARDVEYDGREATIYVTPGEPTQITFPNQVTGGFKSQKSNVNLEKQDNYLVLFAKPGLKREGESVIVAIEDKRTYALRVRPSDETLPRDDLVEIHDLRPPMIVEEEELIPEQSRKKVRNPISKLMRDMIMVAEFGKKKQIAGYRRSNRYSGETVMHDGALEATIEEIFMGSDLWGYVLRVENKLDITQRLNPASFRLDGARAVSAQNWELAPRPQNDEQMIANAHQGKVYIITQAKRR
jgi:hypothetical protein